MRTQLDQHHNYLEVKPVCNDGEVVDMDPSNGKVCCTYFVNSKYP